MSHTIYTASPSSLKVKAREVLRYLNVKEPDEAFLSLIYDCIEQCRRVIMPKAVYIKCPASTDGKTVDLGGLRMDSQKLSAFLDGANEAYVFVATLGAMADREVNKYLRAEPSRGVILNAVMVAFIEEFCDKLNGYLLGVDASTKRFSPGYGDLALEHQKAVLALLDAQRTVGITLTDTYLMVPTKSVSAIVGIK
jgi:hypothetical protein